MAQESRAAVVPPQRHDSDRRRPGRSGRGRCRVVGQGAVEIRRLGRQPISRGRLSRLVPPLSGGVQRGRGPAPGGGGAGSPAGQAAPRGQPRPEPLLRRDRQARRREDARQDLDQRIAARLMATALRRNEPLDPVELAAELIRRPSVTPKDEGAIPYLAGVLDRLAFPSHVQEFTAPATNPLLNLYPP